MVGRARFLARIAGSLAVAASLSVPPVVRAQGECGPCAAPPAASSILYRLTAGSFQVGCWDPCACPVMMRSGLKGTFLLTPSTPGPLFAEYLLCDIDWTVPAVGAGSDIRLRGNGWYRVGGEVAVQHELRLCLTVDGGPAQRFESGLVPGGGAFPAIDIEAAVHGFFCWDTVVAVHAEPAAAGIAVDGTGVGLRVRPNPAIGPMEIELVLPRSALVSCTVLDIQGRELGVLAPEAWHPAGYHLLRWDGTRRDGSRAPAGLYLMRLRIDGRAWTRRLVRL